jgi:hypothetical protein
MKQSDHYRSIARQHLEAGIAKRVQTLWYEIKQAYPNIDNVFDLLKEELGKM